MKSRKRGFTLVETIFSTLFISLTVLAIVNLFPGAYLSVKKSEIKLHSDLLANSIIEELRTYRFDDLPAGELSSTEPLFQVQKFGREDEPEGIDHSGGDETLYFPKVYIDDTVGDPKYLKGIKVEIWIVASKDELPGNGGNTLSTLDDNPVVVYETYLHSIYENR